MSQYEGNLFRRPVVVDCEFQLVVEQGAVFHPGVAARDDFFSDRVRCSGDVRFGSKAEVFAGSKEVRFVPEADMPSSSVN
jgi:hypothetical protein